jgi:hypothetical protein
MPGFRHPGPPDREWLPVWLQRPCTAWTQGVSWKMVVFRESRERVELIVSVHGVAEATTEPQSTTRKKIGRERLTTPKPTPKMTLVAPPLCGPDGRDQGENPVNRKQETTK